jgi:hypothetical protein
LAARGYPETPGTATVCNRRSLPKKLPISHVRRRRVSPAAHHYNTYWRYAGDYHIADWSAPDALLRTQGTSETQVTSRLREIFVLTQRFVRSKPSRRQLSYTLSLASLKARELAAARPKISIVARQLGASFPYKSVSPRSSIEGHSAQPHVRGNLDNRRVWPKQLKLGRATWILQKSSHRSEHVASIYIEYFARTLEINRNPAHQTASNRKV